jgi:hypothetical protein
MAGRAKEPGPSSARVAANLRKIRLSRDGLSTAALSRRLGLIKQPILDTGITKIEKGDRKVDVDDLVALAVALGVTPNRLLLPEIDLPAVTRGVRLTPAGVTGRPDQLWQWAQGETPPCVQVPGADAWIGTGEHPDLEFSVHNRPYLTVMNADLGGFPASEAQAKVMRDLLVGVVSALAEGRTATEVRRIVEIGILTTILEGPEPALARMQQQAARRSVEAADGEAAAHGGE